MIPVNSPWISSVHVSWNLAFCPHLGPVESEGQFLSSPPGNQCPLKSEDFPKSCPWTQWSFLKTVSWESYHSAGLHAFRIHNANAFLLSNLCGAIKWKPCWYLPHHGTIDVSAMMLGIKKNKKQRARNSRKVISLDIVSLSKRENFLELFSECPSPQSEVVHKEANFNPAQTNMTWIHMFVAVLVTSWDLCETRNSWCIRVCVAEFGSTDMYLIDILVIQSQKITMELKNSYNLLILQQS